MTRLLWALLVWGCVHSPTPTLVPQVAQEPDSLGWVEAATRIAAADGYIAGRITQLEEDWTYDDPCGFVAILAKRCGGTVTYRLHIANATDDRWLWAFTPAYGTFGLAVGQHAVFVWRVLVTYRYFECRQHQGMGSYCNYDLLPTLTSDLDVLPVADSARVAALFGH